MKRIAKASTLQTFSSNRDDAIRENLELSQWLEARTTFQEVRDVMPELVKRRFFCAAIGVTFKEKIYTPDRLLVVGRDSELGQYRDSQEQRRLESLAQSLTPGNNRLFIVTYDQLIVQVSARLHAF